MEGVFIIALLFIFIPFVLLIVFASRPPKQKKWQPRGEVITPRGGSGIKPQRRRASASAPSPIDHCGGPSSWADNYTVGIDPGEPGGSRTVVHEHHHLPEPQVSEPHVYGDMDVRCEAPLPEGMTTDDCGSPDCGGCDSSGGD